MRRPGDIFLLTSSSPTVTLFSQHVDPSRRPASLLASVLVHAVVIALVSFGILFAPVSARVVTDHYMIRNLDLRTPDEQIERAARGQRAAVSAAARALASAGALAPARLQQAVKAPPGPQTLLQPDLPIRLQEAEPIPVPQVMIWTPRIKVVKNIVAPQPAPPTAAEARPSPDAPNQEINLAGVNIASSNLPTQKLAILPSSTTPLAARNPSPVQLPPSTVSQAAAQPTPTAVLSLSDLRLKDGAAALPPVNESASKNAPGAMMGSADRPGTQGKSAGGSGAGQDSADPATVAGNAGPAGRPNGAFAGPPQGADSGQGIGDRPTSTEIALPRDGHFGAVVVGESVTDQFPEMAGVWSGRMAYTVYLHVGQSRSWILQYSLPSAADAAANGAVARLDAPWPYNIVRPNLAPGAIDADALMIHGFVNQSGRFENLSMVFPQANPQAQFVLSSLAKWQFRPATQNGQSARVEVLIIIPEEME